MLTHTSRHQCRALAARTIIAGTATWLCASGSVSIADPDISTPKPQAQVQITSIEASPSVLDKAIPPQAGADAGPFIERLARSGCSVHRSTVITITDRVASTIDQTEDASRQKSDAGIESMAVLIPRFNADGSVTLNISMTGDGTVDNSPQQLSAVRTFRTDSTLLLGSATQAHRGPRTLVFVTVHLPEVSRTPGHGSETPASTQTTEG